MKLNVNINPKFKEYFMTNDYEVLLLEGGGASGKSYFGLEQLAVFKMLLEPKSKQLVLRKIATTLKKSVIADVLDGLENIGLQEDVHFTYNRTEREITLNVKVNGMDTKGNSITFRGLENPEKIKSFKGITDIYMEEASDFTLLDYQECKIRRRGKVEGRTRKLILMTNPTTTQSWIRKVFFDVGETVTEKYADDDLEELRNKPKKWWFETKEIIKGVEKTFKHKVFLSNYDDNEYLDDSVKAQIESLKRYDLDTWRKYRLGLAEELKEKIIKKYTIQDLGEVRGDYRYGLDFGYSSHETGAIEAVIMKEQNILYVKTEIIYSLNLTNNDIYDIIEEKGFNDKYFICDSAEPKSIEELTRLGLSCDGADKGAGSVEYGIKKLNSYNIVVNPSCTNVITELENYKRKKDKNGKITPIIIKEYDHLIDAIRYAVSTDRPTIDFF